MTCASNKIDSNVTGLAIAEEECLKQLPAIPVWYAREPNSYSDFGSEITTTARATINPTRQRNKGSVTDVTSSGGIVEDFTPNNITRLMQGYMFADAREQPSTKPMNNGHLVITAVSAKDLSYTADDNLPAFEAGDLVVMKNFSIPSNNGLKRLASVSGKAMVIWGAAADETPSSKAVIQRVGREFDEGDVVSYYENGIYRIVATKGSFTTLNLIPGCWVFLGGAGNHSFANNVGYARVSAVSGDGKTVYFDQTTWYPASSTGEGVALQLFVGTIIRNETESNLIKRRSYQLERTLGTDAYGTQVEYITGAVPDEFKMTIPQSDKMTVELSFTGCDTEQYDGKTGVKAGTRVAALGEEAYNSTSNVYRTRMSIESDTSTNPDALFGYISEGSIDLKNNLSANKAVGKLGAFDVSAGTFEVSGSVTAYFTNIAATQAVRNNADVGWYSIYTKDNSAAIFDLPLISLGGGRLAVEVDNPITIPLDTNAAQSKYGHTMLTEFFVYLPNVAMAQ